MMWAIVVAAGTGTRFGGAKQLALLGDRTVLEWSLDACGQADGLVLVVAPDQQAAMAASPPAGVDVLVAGGSTRSESVRAGIAAVPPEADVIVIHDAARPLAPPTLVSAVVDAVRAGADGAVPVLPVVDTIKQVDADGVVRATLDRTSLVAVQTPQGFRAAALRAAHADAPEATDDAAVIEQWGGRVVTVPGAPRNHKITVPEDLDRMRGWHAEASKGSER